MIIDGHTHLTEPAGLLIDRMERDGIDRSVICSSGLAQGEKIDSLQTAESMMNNISEARKKDNELDPGLTAEENRRIASFINKYPGKLIGFGKVDLRSDKDTIVTQVQQIKELGLAGIGEIIGIKKQIDKLKTLFCRDNREGCLPLFIHTDYPVTVKDLKNIIDLAEKYSDVPVILGHMGGDHWIQAIRGAKRCDNIFLDISEAVNFIPVKLAIRELPDRVIFGSDFPWEIPRVGLTRLENIAFEREVKEKILSSNLLSILAV